MLFDMESTHDPTDQIRALERSEAAPYVDVPAGPLWIAPVFGVWAAAYVGAFAFWSNISIFIVAMLSLSALIGLFIGWFTRSYGAFPMPGRGTPPSEIRREYRLYAVGVVVVAGLVVLAWWLSGLLLASIVAFVLATGGLLAYAARYKRAAHAVKDRLR